MDIKTESRAEATVTSAGRSQTRVTKLHPIIGAQVHGVDLSKPLDEDTQRSLKRAIADHTVLLFRNQRITSEDQRRFASYFGPLAERLKPPATSGVKGL